MDDSKEFIATIVTIGAAIVAVVGLVAGFSHASDISGEKRVASCVEAGGNWSETTDTQSCTIPS